MLPIEFSTNSLLLVVRKRNTVFSKSFCTIRCTYVYTRTFDPRVTLDVIWLQSQWENELMEIMTKYEHRRIADNRDPKARWKADEKSRINSQLNSTMYSYLSVCVNRAPIIFTTVDTDSFPASGTCSYSVEVCATNYSVSSVFI